MSTEEEKTEQQKFWDLAVEDIKNCTPPGHDIDRRWSNAIAKSNGDMERAKSIYRKNIVWQMMNFKHLGLYVLVGIVSALVTHVTAVLTLQYRAVFILPPKLWTLIDSTYRC